MVKLGPKATEKLRYWIDIRINDLEELAHHARYYGMPVDPKWKESIKHFQEMRLVFVGDVLNEDTLELPAVVPPVQQAEAVR